MVWPLGRRSRSRRSRSKDRGFLSNIPVLRWIGPSFTLSGVMGLLFMAVTGRIDLQMFDQWLGDSPGDTQLASSDANSSDVPTDHGSPTRRSLSHGATETSTLPPPRGPSTQPVSFQLDRRSAETIRIATFNIQFFGPSKVSQPSTMQAIAKIVSQFDVVAIQEVRNASVRPIEELIKVLRGNGLNYASSVSQSIGEGQRYKEAYAFVFDENRVAIVPGSAYVVNDPDQLMSREPMVASFQVRRQNAENGDPFRFTLINAHTSPSEVAEDAIINEMDVLDDVYTSVRNYEYEMSGEEDFILLGDLNVDTGGLRQLGQIPNVYSVAGDVLTNTRRSKTYDHILIDRNLTREYTGQHGVLDLRELFSISEEEAIRISDHQPLWAEFTAYELPQQSASTRQREPTIAARPSHSLQR